MRFALPSLLVVSLLIAPAAARAQTIDASGHWEGTISTPMGEMLFHVDLSKNAKGDVIGTYSRPDNNLAGLPLTRVTLDGRAIGFVLTGNTIFEGVLQADGKTISGDVTAPIGTAPFTMTRTGVAVFAPAPKNSPIAGDVRRDMERYPGAAGRESAAGLANDESAGWHSQRHDRKRRSRWPRAHAGHDPEGVNAHAQLASRRRRFFTGALNAAGELAGTFTQGPVSAPLTFVRAVAAGAKE